MKKVVIISILSILALTLGACGNNSVKSNTIVEAELTDREEGILSTASSQ